MNIGFDAKRLYCNFTGLGNYSRTLVKNLYHRYPNNAYTLYTPKVKGNVETDFFLKHKSIRTFIPEIFLKSWWRSFSITKQLVNDKIDLYHGLSHELPFGIRSTGIKSIVTIHDLIFEVYPKTYSFLDRLIYRAKFKYACRQADRIIAISESTKNDIVRYFHIDPAKIDVVYQACNPLFAEKKSEEEVTLLLKPYSLPEKFFLYVGSVIERKNLITIIEAYTHLNGNNRLPLVIVGKGKKYKDLVKARIAELGLEQWVIWIDNLTDNNHLQAIYQRASIFIYPSVYEGFGIPVIEALLSHTPVITSNTSSLPEAAGPFSICIDPLDAKQLAEGIQKILSDTDYRNLMIEKGYTYATENFSGEIVTEKLMDVYKKVMERK